MEEIRATAEKLHAQKYSWLYEICADLFRREQVAVHKDIGFHNNPRRIAEQLVDAILAAKRSLASAKTRLPGQVYSIEYESFTVYTIYHSNIDNELFMRDLYYRAAYDPTKLEDIALDEYTPIQAPQKYVEHIEHPSFSNKLGSEIVYVGGRAYNYYLDLPAGNYFPEIIVDNFSEFLSHYEHRVHKIPLYTDVGLAAAEIFVDGMRAAIVYNSAEHELIPYKDIGYRIGSPFVVLRFLLVRLYFERLVDKKKNSNLIHIHNRLLETDFTKLPKKMYGVHRDPRTLFGDHKEYYKPYLISLESDISKNN